MAAEELDFEDLISQNIITNLVTNNEDSKVSIETKPIKDYELIYDKTGSSFDIKVKSADDVDDDNRSSDDDEEPLISVQKKMRLNHNNLIKKRTNLLATCDECHLSFKTARGLKRHKHVHKTKRKYKTKAELKEIATDSLVSLLNHRNDEEENSDTSVEFDVDLSMERRNTRRSKSIDNEMEPLEEERAFHVTGEDVKCDECGKVCVGERGLLVHRKTHNKKSWNCEECDLTFDSIAKLEKHNEVHLSPQYSWSEAGEMEESDGADENEDDDNEEEEYDPNKFECEECGRVCASALGLSSHMNTHKNKKAKNLR